MPANIDLDNEQCLLYEDSFDTDYWAKITNFRSYIINFIKGKDFKVGAELGVRRGFLLFALLKNCPQLFMYAIDIWEFTKADEGKTFPHSKNERLVREKAEKFKDRVKIIKDFTNNASKQIENASLDFVFIDADHSYYSCKEDIQLWLPKVKDTGYLLGDDFDRAPGVKKAVEELLPKYSVLSPNVWVYKK